MIPYIKDSWRSGISDEESRGVRGSFKYAYGLDIHKRRDSISCQKAMLQLHGSTVVKDLIKYAVTAQDGSTYCFGDKGSIYAISGNIKDPVLTGVYNDENGEIRGACEWKDTDGVNYLYWATATSLARVALNGALDTPWVAGAATQDYKTTLDDTTYHDMQIAAGRLCIANGNYLANLDYSGNFNPAAMNLRPGNVIKCLEERDDYVLFGSERIDTSEKGYIWNWIVSAVNWVQKKKIPVRGINAMIDTERLLLQGGTDGEFFYSDFVNASPLNSIPNGGQCNSAIDVWDDRAMFGMYGSGDQSGLWSYGRKNMNRPFALNHDFRLSPTVDGNTISEIGATWVASSAVFASYRVAGSADYYGIDMISSSTRATARLEGLEFNAGQPHLRKQYDSEKVTMKKLPAGCSVNLLYRTDLEKTGGDSSAGEGWKYAKVADGSGTTYSTEGSTEAEFIINENAKIFEIGMELTPSGLETPEITGSIGYIANNMSDH